MRARREGVGSAGRGSIGDGAYGPRGPRVNEYLWPPRVRGGSVALGGDPLGCECDDPEQKTASVGRVGSPCGRGGVQIPLKRRAALSPIR